jgi:hypothetical protein
LTDKMLALQDGILDLQTRTGRTADDDRKLGDSLTEYLACKARYDAIKAGGTFSLPPQEERDRLTNAIDKLAEVRSQTAAAAAIATALMDVADAMPARST